MAPLNFPIRFAYPTWKEEGEDKAYLIYRLTAETTRKGSGFEIGKKKVKAEKGNQGNLCILLGKKKVKTKLKTKLELLESLKVPVSQEMGLSCQHALQLPLQIVYKKPSNSTVPGQSASSVNQEPQKRISVVYGIRDHGETSLDVSNNIELGLQLWKNLDNLIVLLEKLQCWSRKSPPLHAEGSGEVLKWLKALKTHHGFYQDEPGILLLSSCWKHYSMLLCLEDHQLLHRFNELIDQYLSGIEFYSEDGPKENEESIKETRKFFMNCLALLLGRLDDKRLSSLMADDGVGMSNVLLSQVLYPVLLSQLESATELKDTLRIKALLFALCSSLVVRGKGAISHPTLIRIREILQTILLWSSVDDDEAQHGCIDCLALMICAELQDSNNTSADLALEKSTGGKTNLTLVIKLLTEENPGRCLPADVSESSSSQRLLSPLSYRLCMANVLISACQKIPDPCKKTFAQKTLPLLYNFSRLMVTLSMGRRKKQAQASQT